MNSAIRSQQISVILLILSLICTVSFAMNNHQANLPQEVIIETVDGKKIPVSKMVLNTSKTLKGMCDDIVLVNNSNEFEIPLEMSQKDFELILPLMELVSINSPELSTVLNKLSIEDLINVTQHVNYLDIPEVNNTSTFLLKEKLAELLKYAYRHPDTFILSTDILRNLVSTLSLDILCSHFLFCSDVNQKINKHYHKINAHYQNAYWKRNLADLKKAISPNGHFYFILSSCNIIDVWDLENGDRRAWYEVNCGVGKVCFSANSSIAIGYGGKNGCCMLPLQYYSWVYQHQRDNGYTGLVSLNSDGSLAASTSVRSAVDTALYIWNEHHECFNSYIFNKIDGQCLSASGNLLAIIGIKEWEYGLYIYDVKNQKIICSQGMLWRGHKPDTDTKETIAAEFSSDEKLLAVCSFPARSGNRVIKLFNTAAGQCIRTFDTGYYFREMCFSPDGSMLAVDQRPRYGEISLRIWNIKSGTYVDKSLKDILLEKSDPYHFCRLNDKKLFIYDLFNKDNQALENYIKRDLTRDQCLLLLEIYKALTNNYGFQLFNVCPHSKFRTAFDSISNVRLKEFVSRFTDHRCTLWCALKHTSTKTKLIASVGALATGAAAYCWLKNKNTAN